MVTTQNINTTKIYNFKRIPGNRRLSAAHVKNLYKSILEDPSYLWASPIIVNEFYEIIDGQHRYEALKMAGLPVPYVMVKGLRLKDAQRLNAGSKTWSPLDYAKSYAEIGNRHYLAYVDFKEAYRLNHDTLMKYLALDLPVSGDGFRHGTFQTSNLQESKKLCEALLDIAPFYDRYNTRAFALAFYKAWKAPGYDHNHMVARMGNPKLVQKHLGNSALPEDNLRALEAIYNYRTNDLDRVRFF